MSFPRYPEYKDSGVELLGQIPSHWTSLRLKNAAMINMGQSPNSDDCNDSGNGLPFLQGNADFGKVNPTPRSYCPVANKIANLGDILFSVRAPVGAINVADQRYGIGRGLCAITTHHDHSQGYMFHAMQFVREELFSVATGSTYEAVSTEQIANARFLAPPPEEQGAIAAFLDRETAKIDALIAEQEKIIVLLKEKRQAVISHAVTKGLNPDAPMKYSGVKWLGKIPSHWKVTRLKYATSLIVDCPHETPTYSDDGEYLVIRTADIEEGRIDESAMYRVDESEYLNRIRRQSLLASDIVYGREGERWGHAALVPADDTYCLGQRMMQFRAASHYSPEFLMWLLNAETTYLQGQIDTVGATSPHINVGTIKNYALTAPPYEEQVAIGEYLRQEAEGFDGLMDEVARGINLLKERRSALISAAVTGNIDVRGIK